MFKYFKKLYKKLKYSFHNYYHFGVFSVKEEATIAYGLGNAIFKARKTELPDTLVIIIDNDEHALMSWRADLHKFNNEDYVKIGENTQGSLAVIRYTKDESTGKSNKQIEKPILPFSTMVSRSQDNKDQCPYRFFEPNDSCMH